jgi:hypothetical protein
LIQERPLAFADRLHLLERVDELLDVAAIDSPQLLELVFSFVGPRVEVGQLVVPFADAELGPRRAARLIVVHKRRDPRGVGLEPQHHQVAEQAGMLGVLGRNPFG